MSKTKKIFSDFSKIATDAFGTISDIKKEIEAIVKIRIEKVINRANLVKRKEFEISKQILQKHSKKIANLEKTINILKKKNISKLKKKR